MVTFSNNSFTVQLASYPITVGAGGAGPFSSISRTGGNKVFQLFQQLSSAGGGGGGGSGTVLLEDRRWWRWWIWNAWSNIPGGGGNTPPVSPSSRKSWWWEYFKPTKVADGAAGASPSDAAMWFKSSTRICGDGGTGKFKVLLMELQ